MERSPRWAITRSAKETVSLDLVLKLLDQAFIDLILHLDLNWVLVAGYDDCHNGVTTCPIWRVRSLGIVATATLAASRIGMLKVSP